MGKKSKKTSSTSFDTKKLFTDTGVGAVNYQLDEAATAIKTTIAEGVRAEGDGYLLTKIQSNIGGLPVKSLSFLSQFLVSYTATNDINKSLRLTTEDVAFHMGLNQIPAVGSVASSAISISSILNPIAQPLANALQELRENNLQSVPKIFLQDIRLLEGLLRTPEGILYIGECLKDWAIKKPVDYLTEKKSSVLPNDSSAQAMAGNIKKPTGAAIDDTSTMHSVSNAKSAALKNNSAKQNTVPSPQTPPQKSNNINTSEPRNVSSKPDFSPGKKIFSDISNQAKTDAAQEKLLPNRPVAPNTSANNRPNMVAGLCSTSDGKVGGTVRATVPIGDGGANLAVNITTKGGGLAVLTIPISSTAAAVAGGAVAAVAAIGLTSYYGHRHLHNKRAAHVPYFLTFDDKTNEQLAMGLYNLHKGEGKLSHRQRNKFEKEIKDARKIAKTPEQKLSLDFLSDLINKGHSLKNELGDLYGNDTYKTIKDSSTIALIEAYDALSAKAAQAVPDIHASSSVITSNLDVNTSANKASPVNPAPATVNANDATKELTTPNNELKSNIIAPSEAVSSEIVSPSGAKDFFQKLQMARKVNYEIIENLQQEKNPLTPEQQQILTVAQVTLSGIQGAVDNLKNLTFIAGYEGNSTERENAIEQLKEIQFFESNNPQCSGTDQAATFVYLGNLIEKDTLFFHQEACDYYIKASELDPKNPEAAIGHAEALCNRGQHEAAKDVLQECGKKNNNIQLFKDQINTIKTKFSGDRVGQKTARKEAYCELKKHSRLQNKLQDKQKEVAQRQLGFRIFYGRLGLKGFTCCARWVVKQYGANNFDLDEQIKKFGNMSETVFVNGMQLMFAQARSSQCFAVGSLALQLTPIGKMYNNYINSFFEEYSYAARALHVEDLMWDAAKVIQAESVMDGITGAFTLGAYSVPGWAHRNLFEKWREEGRAPTGLFGVVCENVAWAAGNEVTSTVLYLYCSQEAIYSGMGMAGDFITAGDWINKGSNLIHQAGDLINQAGQAALNYSPEMLKKLTDGSVYIGQFVISHCPETLQTLMQAAVTNGQPLVLGVSEFFKDGLVAAGGKTTTAFLSAGAGVQVAVVGGVVIGLTAAGYIYYNHCCYTNALNNAHKKLELIGSNYKKAQENLRVAVEYALEIKKWDKESYLVYWGILRQHDEETNKLIKQAQSIWDYLKKAELLIGEKDIASLLSELSTLDKDTRELCASAIHARYVDEETDLNHHIAKIQEDKTISPKERADAIMFAVEELSNNAHQRYLITQVSKKEESREFNQFKAKLAKNVITYEFQLLLQGRGTLERTTEYMRLFEANPTDQAALVALKNQWAIIQEINKPLDQQNAEIVLFSLKNMSNDERNNMREALYFLGMKSNSSCRTITIKIFETMIDSHDKEYELQKAKTHRCLGALKAEDNHVDHLQAFEHYQNAFELEPENIDGSIGYANEIALRSGYIEAMNTLQTTLATIKDSDENAEEKRQKINEQIRSIESRSISSGAFYGNIVLQLIAALAYKASNSSYISEANQRNAEQIAKWAKLIDAPANFVVQIIQHAQLIFPGKSEALDKNYQERLDAFNYSEAQLIYAAASFGLQAFGPHLKSDMLFVDALKTGTSIASSWKSVYDVLLKITSSSKPTEWIEAGLNCTRFLIGPASFLQRNSLEQIRQAGKAPTSLPLILLEDAFGILNHPIASKLFNFYGNKSAIRDGIGWMLSLCPPLVSQYLESTIKFSEAFVNENSNLMIGMMAFVASASFYQYYNYRWYQNMLNNTQVKMVFFSQDNNNFSCLEEAIENLNHILYYFPNDLMAAKVKRTLQAIQQVYAKGECTIEEIVINLDACVESDPDNAKMIFLTKISALITATSNDSTLLPEEKNKWIIEGISTAKRLFSLHPALQITALYHQFNFERAGGKNQEALVTLDELENRQDNLSDECREVLTQTRVQLIEAIQISELCHQLNVEISSGKILEVFVIIGELEKRKKYLSDGFKEMLRETKEKLISFFPEFESRIRNNNFEAEKASQNTGAIDSAHSNVSTYNDKLEQKQKSQNSIIKFDKKILRGAIIYVGGVALIGNPAGALFFTSMMIHLNYLDQKKINEQLSAKLMSQKGFFHQAVSQSKDGSESIKDSNAFDENTTLPKEQTEAMDNTNKAANMFVTEASDNNSEANLEKETTKWVLYDQPGQGPYENNTKQKAKSYIESIGLMSAPHVVPKFELRADLGSFHR